MGELGPCHVRFPAGIPLMESIRPQLASNHSRITLLCYGCRCQSLEKVPHIWHEAEAAKTALQMHQHQHQQLDTAAAVTLFHRLVRLCCTHAGLGCRALLTGCCRGRKKYILVLMVSTSGSHVFMDQVSRWGGGEEKIE